MEIENINVGKEEGLSELEKEHLETVRHTPCYTSFLQRIQAKAR